MRTRDHKGGNCFEPGQIQLQETSGIVVEGKGRRYLFCLALVTKQHGNALAVCVAGDDVRFAVLINVADD